MSLTRKKPAELDTSSTLKAAQRARKASSAAAANAANAAQNAALTAQNAAVVATNAARNASGAAQTAAAGMSKGARQGVYTARSWAAPRLDSAADYCTTTVAPKVSTALRNTARQVRPPEPANSKRSSILTWSVLGASVLAALGAAATAARYRYRTAIAADSETADEEVMADSAGSQTAPVPADESKSQGAKQKDQGQGPETSVNGRVSASGR